MTFIFFCFPKAFFRDSFSLLKQIQVGFMLGKPGVAWGCPSTVVPFDLIGGVSLRSFARESYEP